jgi:hypothetical protein
VSVTGANIIKGVYDRRMASSERYLQLADLASSQWGMITAAQARHLDVSPQQIARMNRSGVLQRLHHGVYRLAGVPHDPLADLRAAWLALDPEATAAARLARPDPIGVVSHRSAARVHQLGDLDADVNEFTVTAPKRTRHPDARMYKRDLDDWEVIGGLPTTTVATTISNLAAAALDGGHLAGIIRDAILHAKISYADVVTLLRPYAHDYGAPLGDGRTLTKSLLAQAGLTSTLIAAKRLGDAEDTWLAAKLETTANQYLGRQAVLRLVDEYSADAELLGAPSLGRRG